MITNEDEAVAVLRKLNFIKLEFPTFLILTKQDKIPNEDKAELMEAYGDAIYFPSADTILADLTSYNPFLKLRNEKRYEMKSEIEDVNTFDKALAYQYIEAAGKVLGIKLHFHEKLKGFIGKHEMAKLKAHSNAGARDLYSHIIRSNMSVRRKGNTSSWG